MSSKDPVAEEKILIIQIEKIWIKAKRVQKAFYLMILSFMKENPDRDFSFHFYSDKNKVTVLIRRKADHPDLKWYWYNFKFK